MLLETDDTKDIKTGRSEDTEAREEAEERGDRVRGESKKARGDKEEKKRRDGKRREGAPGEVSTHVVEVGRDGIHTASEVKVVRKVHHVVLKLLRDLQLQPHVAAEGVQVAVHLLQFAKLAPLTPEAMYTDKKEMASI